MVTDYFHRQSPEDAEAERVAAAESARAAEAESTRVCESYGGMMNQTMRCGQSQVALRPVLCGTPLLVQATTGMGKTNLIWFLAIEQCRRTEGSVPWSPSAVEESATRVAWQSGEGKRDAKQDGRRQPAGLGGANWDLRVPAANTCDCHAHWGGTRRPAWPGPVAFFVAG